MSPFSRASWILCLSALLSAFAPFQAKALYCHDAHAVKVSTKRKASPSKKFIEAAPVKVSDADSFAEAMTKGMLLNPNQKDLFGLYLAMYFGNPKTDLAGKSFATVMEILSRNPGLQKPHFPEFLISKVVKVYASPAGLTRYVQGQIATAGQFRSNLFQIDANLGFWKKLLAYQDIPVPKGSSKEAQREIAEKNKMRFEKYLAKIIGPENRNLLKNEDVEYEIKIQVLFRTLERVALHFSKNGKDPKAIYQTMIDLVQTTGYNNPATLALLKGSDGLGKIEGLAKINDERDSMAMKLGCSGHFTEMLQKYHVPFSSITGVPEATTAKMITAFQTEVMSGPFTTKAVDSLRVRSLSIQEAGFRSCLGGSDCSSRTYFSKAFDPNYNYFTMTDKHHHSSGHATVVLGTARDEKGREVKVAFLDKLQNVPDQLVPEFLLAVKRSLAEKKYLLAIPVDLGDHNGISNMPTTRDFLARNVMPDLQRTLVGFKPHPHEHQFPNEYSRADLQLTVRVFDLKTSAAPETEVKPGVKYKAYQADPSLKMDSLIAKFLALRDSKDPDEIMQFITSGRTVDLLEKQNLYTRKAFLQDLVKVMENSDQPYRLRKTAWLEYYQATSDWLPIFVHLQRFTEGERITLFNEVRSWSGSSNESRKNFSATFFRTVNAWSFSYAGDSNWQMLHYLFRHRLIDGNAKDESRNTLFHVAAQKGNLELARRLASVPGVKLNERNNENLTPAMITWRYWNLALEFMRIPGVDVNVTDAQGKSLLHRAVDVGAIESVKLILEIPGVDKNLRDQSGATPLFTALGFKSPEIAELLLQSPGVDPNLGKGSTTPLMWARSNREDLFVRLWSTPGVRADSESQNYRQQLILRMLDDERYSRRKLMDLPGDFNFKDSKGRTFLVVALERYSQNHSENVHHILVQLLKIPSVHTTVPREYAEMLFCFAARAGNLAVMEQQLNTPNLDINKVISKYPVTETSTDGFTALEAAVLGGHLEAVNLILKQPGLKIRNFGDYDGPLYGAAYASRGDLVEALLTFPGRKVGPWPLFMAMKRDDKRIFNRLLQETIDDINGPYFEWGTKSLIQHVFEYGGFWYLQKLLQVPGIDINYRYVKQKSSGTVYYGKSLIESLLLRIRHSNPDSERGRDLMTCLELLIKDPRLNLKMTNEDGRTPLILAIFSREPRAVAMILKRKNEFPVDHKDSDGWTALDYAKYIKDPEMIELLQ